MKVVQFLAYFPPHKGGVETVAQEFSKYFISEKHGEVLNVVFSVGQNSLQKYDQDGYRVIIIPAFELIHNYPFPKFWKKQFRSILKGIKQRNPDIIQTHTRFFIATFLGGLCAKLWRKKRVHIEHGSGFVKGLIWRKKWFADIYDYSLGAWIFRNTNALIAISKANLAFIQKFTKNHVEVIYRGIEFPQIQKKNKKSDQIHLVFIGRLVKLKGVDLLLSAFSKINIDYPQTRLIIVGGGDQEKILKAQVEKLNLKDVVTFHGELPHDQIINQILPETDIFINPSLQEGLPTSVIEALLAKNIVVATDVGGTREISNKADLILITTKNKNSLKNGIKQAIQKYKNLSGLSEEEVRLRFNWKEKVKEYLRIYINLIKQK